MSEMGKNYLEKFRYALKLSNVPKCDFLILWLVKDRRAKFFGDFFWYGPEAQSGRARD